MSLPSGNAAPAYRHGPPVVPSTAEVVIPKGQARTTTVVARGFPPELLHAIDHDPRFQIATLDGRWLDPYTGEAITAPQGLRAAALRRMAQRSDWRQRTALGMGELAIRKHFHDLEIVIPRDERLRIIDSLTGCWVNPYNGRVETTLRLEAKTLLDPEKRLVMARILSRTPEMRGPILATETLLSGDRRILPSPVQIAVTQTMNPATGQYGVPATGIAQPVARPPTTGSRTASAVFRQIPKVAGWDFGVYASSHQQVGGDFYEIHQLSDHQVLVVLGDVSGHGMQGAQAATALLKALRRSVDKAGDLAALAIILNEACSGFLPHGKFITLFLATIDLSTGKGQFVACGHHRPLILAPGRQEMLSTPGGPSMALGLTGTGSFSKRAVVHEFTLRHGDWLVQCSDGIIEAQRSDEELFGLTRYAGIALFHADDSPSQLVNAVAEAATRFAGGNLDDDCTVVAVRRLAPQQPHNT